MKSSVKSIKNLAVTITKNTYDVYRINYSHTSEKMQKGIARWFTLTLDLTSRMEFSKWNLLHRLLYLFQLLLIEIPQCQFIFWDKISRLGWRGQRPRVEYKIPQLSKEKRGMGPPKLKEYYLL